MKYFLSSFVRWTSKQQVKDAGDVGDDDELVLMPLRHREKRREDNHELLRKNQCEIEERKKIGQQTIEAEWQSRYGIE